MSKREKPEKPPISDAEWEVMRLLWERAPQTAAEIIEALATRKAWHPKTIRTLLSRLVQKEVIAFEPDGRQYLYRPIVGQTDCERAEARSFLARVFDGAVTPMIAQLADDGALDGEDLDALRKLLDDRAKVKGGKR